MGKKRKAELDLDVERTMYHSFVSAANSISHLYTQAVQQHRKAATAGAKNSLERVLCFALRDYSNCETIPVKALVDFLQQEYEGLNGQEAMPSPLPVHPFPVAPQGTSHPIGDESAEDSQPKPVRSPAPSCSGFGSNSARRASCAGASGPMDVAEQDRGMTECGSSAGFALAPGFPDQGSNERKLFSGHSGFPFS